MDAITAVIVSYQKDLHKFSKCLESITVHGQIFQEIIVVVNDDPPVVNLFQKFSQCDSRVKILHWSELASWDRSLDWWSQQYFKLAVSQVISTPWYLLIDSDDLLIQDIDKNVLFDQGRACCRIEDINLIDQSSNQELIKYLLSARRFVGVPDRTNYTMGNLTPMMMHTTTVQDLLKIINPGLFDVITPDKLVLEFYLYHAWLERCGTFEILYHPVRFFSNFFGKTI